VAGNPWDNDTVVTPAPSAPTASSGNPWDNDAIVTPAPQAATAAKLPLGDGGFVNPFDVGAVGDAALTVGSGFLKSVTGAVNDLLPESIGGAGSRAQMQKAIDADPVFNYQPQTEGGKQIVNTLGKVAAPIGAAGQWATGQIASAFGQRAADVVGDVATLAPTPLSAEAAGVVKATPGAVVKAAEAAGKVLPRTAEGAADAASTASVPPLRPTAASAGVSTDFTPPTPEGTERAALPVDQQIARAQTLRDVGLDEARTSAITGDTKATGTDFQINKLDGDGGDRMSDVIDNERVALQDYAQDLRDATNSTAATPYEAGAIIAKPVEQLHDYYDGQISQAYAAADAASKGMGSVTLPEFQKILDTESSFQNTDQIALRNGVLARMRELGVKGDGNTALPMTVQQAQALRQYITKDQWAPGNAAVNSALRDALDEDVTKVAGQDVYASARAVRAQRGAILDDPNGIAKLAPASDRLGINRAVPLEQIPSYVATLPVDQFNHIVGTLTNVRDTVPALGESASAALNEIRAHFANKVIEQGNSTQGMWNAKGVSKYLRDNEPKMRLVYSPERMQQFKTLNDAGNILRMDRTYPGAAAQSSNLVRTLAGAVKHGGAMAGAVIGEHTGLGELAGVAAGKTAEIAAEKLQGAASRAAVEKRITKLSPTAQQPKGVPVGKAYRTFRAAKTGARASVAGQAQQRNENQ
jgi:hypothetical protein